MIKTLAMVLGLAAFTGASVACFGELNALGGRDRYYDGLRKAGGGGRAARIEGPLTLAARR